MSQRGMVRAVIAHRSRSTSPATEHPPCPRDGSRSSVAHAPTLNGTGAACSARPPQPRSRPGAPYFQPRHGVSRRSRVLGVSGIA